MKKTITLKEEKKEVLAGLRQVKDFYKELSLDSNTHWLYLDKADDIDIPLLPDDYIIIHGGERIIVDHINNNIGRNPSVRNPIRFTFNGKKIEEGFKKSKITGVNICLVDKELKSVQLFADLDGSVDTLIQSDFTLVIQDNDAYFTIPANNDEIIDLEECSKKDRKPPKGQTILQNQN